MTDDQRLIAGVRALWTGDFDATRRYCGAYTLVRRAADGALFRGDRAIPNGYRPVSDSTDDEGYLLPQFWSLPRL